MDQYLKRKAIDARRQKQIDDERRKANDAIDFELQAQYARFRHDFQAMECARNRIRRLQEPHNINISNLTFIDEPWDFAIRIPYRVEHLRVVPVPEHDDITSCQVSQPSVEVAEVFIEPLLTDQAKNRDINDSVERTTCQFCAHPEELFDFHQSVNITVTVSVSVLDTALDHELNERDEILAMMEQPHTPNTSVEFPTLVAPVSSPCGYDTCATSSDSYKKRREWYPTYAQNPLVVMYPSQMNLQAILLLGKAYRGFLFIWVEVVAIFSLSVVVLYGLDPIL